MQVYVHACKGCPSMRLTQGFGDDALQLWMFCCRCPDQCRDVLADVPAPAHQRSVYKTSTTP